mmetsp:Transcript_28303/g.37665  ORF Transcript_28303/g.37665 Transcript_28303/m.37665 type:complete len:415 (-) Transcript_28303:348-1592(-)
MSFDVASLRIENVMPVGIVTVHWTKSKAPYGFYSAGDGWVQILVQATDVIADLEILDLGENTLMRGRCGRDKAVTLITRCDRSGIGSIVLHLRSSQPIMFLVILLYQDVNACVTSHATRHQYGCGCRSRKVQCDALPIIDPSIGIYCFAIDSDIAQTPIRPKPLPTISQSNTGEVPHILETHERQPVRISCLKGIAREVSIEPNFLGLALCSIGQCSIKNDVNVGIRPSTGGSTRLNDKVVILRGTGHVDGISTSCIIDPLVKLGIGIIVNGYGIKVPIRSCPGIVLPNLDFRYGTNVNGIDIDGIDITCLKSIARDETIETDLLRGSTVLTIDSEKDIAIRPPIGHISSANNNSIMKRTGGYLPKRIIHSRQPFRGGEFIHSIDKVWNVIISIPSFPFLNGTTNNLTIGSVGM